jgi:hypothetical protein
VFFGDLLSRGFFWGQIMGAGYSSHIDPFCGSFPEGTIHPAEAVVAEGVSGAVKPGNKIFSTPI